MTHPYLAEWRESHLATWRHIGLNPDYTEPIHLQRPDTPQNAAAQHPPMGAAGAAPRASLDRAGAVMLGSARANPCLMKAKD